MFFFKKFCFLHESKNQEYQLVLATSIVKFLPPKNEWYLLSIQRRAKFAWFFISIFKLLKPISMSTKPSFIKDLSLPAIAAPLFLISGPKLKYEMPIISSSYNPPILFKNGHFSTVYAGIFRKIDDFEQKRERLELDDGDYLDLDWSYKGNAQRAYIAGAAKNLNTNSYDVCAINLRTCSGEMNRLFRSYHSGATEDLDAWKSLIAKQEQYPEKISDEDIKNVVTLKDFDDIYTSRAHGFKDALDYYKQCSSSCGEKKEEKKDGFEMNRTKTEKKAAVSEGVPVDMDNDGVGPFKDITFSDDINTEMAAAGEAKFSAICTACHMAEQRMIGPALKGVYERRSPAWVMNMISNPDNMLKKDPIAKALLKEYNNAIMLNQNLSDDDTRAVAEYLRTL
ncbi:putative esterase YheT [Nymphon striatum]|nr:putative esterase YheT [Nymphon striatum]